MKEKNDDPELIMANLMFTLLQSIKLCEADLKYSLDVYLKNGEYDKTAILYELLDKNYYDYSPSKIKIILEGKKYAEHPSIDTNVERVVNKIRNITDPDELYREVQQMEEFKAEAQGILDSLEGVVSLLTAFDESDQPFILPPLTGKNMENFKRIIAEIKSGKKEKKKKL